MLALHSKKKNKTDTNIISTQFILSLWIPPVTLPKQKSYLPISLDTSCYLNKIEKELPDTSWYLSNHRKMHPLTLTCMGRMCFPPPPPLLEFIYLFIFPLLLLNLIYMRQQLSFPAHISSGRKGRHFALIDVDKRRFGSCSRYLGPVSYIDGGLVHHKWTAC